MDNEETLPQDPAAGFTTAPPPQAPFREEPPKRRWSRPGVIFGLVLVALGVVILAEQFVPALDLLALWPLVIVAAGVMSLFRRPKDGHVLNSVFEALVVITVGVMLLGNTQGFLSWRVWLDVISLWPLLIIAVGVEILGKSLGSGWIRALSSVIVLGGLAFAAFLMPGSNIRPFSLELPFASVEEFEFSESARGRVETGEVKLDVAFGELTIEAGSSLARWSGETALRNPSLDVEQDGDEVKVEVSGGSGSSWSGRTAELDLELSRRVAWDIDVDAGAVRVDADLRDLQVSSLRLDTGVSDVTIELGALAKRANVIVETGVSSVRIYVPRGVGVEVVHEGGLSDVDIASGIERVSGGGPRGTWRTDGFSEADKTIEITLKTGVSDVQIAWGEGGEA